VTAPATDTPRPALDPLGRSFIEVQFPVSKLSKESYKERKAGAGQTLTPLGKWWGRKPLVLVRAIILGLLLPATDDPEADREVFLALMTMDDDGMWNRVKGSIPAAAVYAHSTPRERADLFETIKGKPAYRGDIGKDERRQLQRRAFLRMNYDDRLEYCKRPEEIDGPDLAAWARINAHLGTSVTSLPALVAELGQRRWGHVPRVGDCFSGGGSIPFEAARIGCDAYASDLNPVAGLLTWGALNIVGGGQEAVDRVAAAQRRVFDAVRQQVDAWGIERNDQGWIADAYLYCAEVRDPATGWLVPLAPSWVIAPKFGVGARLVPDHAGKRFDIAVLEGLSAAELERCAEEGTASGGVRCPVDRDGRWLDPAQRTVTSIDQLRGVTGLRPWTNEDLVPRPDDVYQERLYCVRWVDPATGERHYRAPDAADRAREARVFNLLRERFDDWQATGYIPSQRIEPGNETDRPEKERGWTHWHHLFNPRQLLVTGSLMQRVMAEDDAVATSLLLMIGRAADWNSRICRWIPLKSGGIGGGDQTFYNQALNTLFNYSCRPLATVQHAFEAESLPFPIAGSGSVRLCDARAIGYDVDSWITDPGYGDTVVYDEVSEFFLAWYEKAADRLLPGWQMDPKRSLAVRGEGETFRTALAECYSATTAHMDNAGFQVVMFTHQDPTVWGDLGLTLWSAGLHVTSAWTIGTETGGTGLRSGNYVQGTVILILRKRSTDRRGDLADVFPEIQAEVRAQIDTMLAVEDRDDPNFGDADYQLAAYAAALRVLTSYGSIEEIDVQRELRRPRVKGETSPLTRLIQQAVRIASDHLVPTGLDRAVWRKLGPEERLYLKAIEVEAGGEAREGVYQELARGYGAGPHKEMYADRAANRVRFKTPTEFAGRDLGVLGEAGFRGALLRQLLYAVHLTASDPDTDPRAARRYLRTELQDYWQHRLTLVELLRFLGNRADPLPHWGKDLSALRLLQGSLENDAT
jgi:putative DNA methylase